MEQINEINSLIEKYGEGNFAIVDLSPLNRKNGSAYTTNTHRVPETIIKEIYTGISEFDAVTKSSESEHLTVRNRHGLHSGSYQDYREGSVYKFYSIDTSTVVAQPLVVENKGYIVHSSFLKVRGGVCLENVWCGGSGGKQTATSGG